MKLRELAALFFLAALWGASFIFIRVVAPVLGPLVLADVRVILAGAALFLYATVIGFRTSLRSRWRSFLILGGPNAVVPFTLIGTAELHLTAGVAAILNATTPLFGAVVAVFWRTERLTSWKAVGLLLGIVGVAVLVGWSPLPPGLTGIAAVGASLLAALSYALGGNYAKRAFSGVQSLELAMGQQVSAALLLLPVALPLGVSTAPAMHLTPTVVASLLTLSLLCTGFAFLLYFYLIDRVGPTRTLSVTFLVPVFGVFWSVLFLREPVGQGTVAGLGLILGSVLFVSGFGRPAGSLLRRILPWATP